MAGNALAARLVPSHAVLEPSCRGKIKPKALHHAIHQLRLVQDPVQHRPAIAKVAHGESSSNFVQPEGRERPALDLDQTRLRPIGQTLGLRAELSSSFRWPNDPPVPIALSGAAPCAGCCPGAIWPSSIAIPTESGFRLVN